MHPRAVFLAALLVIAGCATETKLPPYQDTRLQPLTSPTLERFHSEAEFADYLRAARKLAIEHGIYWARHDGVEYAELQEVPCPEGQTPPCYADVGKSTGKGNEKVVVTGSRISAPPASITNVQLKGVDEGDIVKQYRHFLIVLQDGRLFSVDTRPGGAAGLKLVDRANVYRKSNEDTWYDEMLIHEGRIVITGYSYERAAAEFSVFTINARGRLAREATYYISSHDYYSGDNYATRLVDDKLIIRTDLALTDVSPDRPLAWPLVRRWQREGEGDASLSKGTQFFGARDIYRPVQPTLEPAIHSVSVCPLGGDRAGDELECKTTAFIAPVSSTYFVSREHAYLWLSPGWYELGDTQKGPACDAKLASAFATGIPSTLFQVPLDGSEPRFMHVRGQPWNQFALDVGGDRFRALVTWNAICESDTTQSLEVKYFSAPLSAFGDRSDDARAEDYVDLPQPLALGLENRFTDRMLVYGGAARWYSHAPEPGEGPLSARVVAVPLGNPRAPVVMETPHNVIRIERAGDNAIVTGYRSDEGLAVSLFDLRREPHLASTETLAHQYESEGRSHAYNSMVEPDGSGLMGIPTVAVERESGRWVWRSQASDVSFLSLSAKAKLRSIGRLSARENAQHKDYKCEVSCVDWYGNTRPIFTDGRVFALTATELVEGRVGKKGIRERRRLNLTAPLSRQ